MDEKSNKNKAPKFNLSWIYGIIVVVLLYLLFTGNEGGNSQSISYTQFERYVNEGYAKNIVAAKDKGVLKMYVKREHVKDVFKGDVSKLGINPYVEAEYASNDKLMELIDKAQQEKKFEGDLRFEQSNDMVGNIFWNFLPLFILIAVWIFIMRRMGGGGPAGSNVFSVGKSKARLIEKGEGTNVPKYYSTYGGSIRFYPRNVLTISASKPIESITMACVDNNITYNASGDLEVSAGTVSVTDEEVSITGIGTDGLVLRNTSTTTGTPSQLRIKSMVITYAE